MTIPAGAEWSASPAVPEEAGLMIETRDGIAPLTKPVTLEMSWVDAEGRRNTRFVAEFYEQEGRPGAALEIARRAAEALTSPSQVQLRLDRAQSAIDDFLRAGLTPRHWTYCVDGLPEAAGTFEVAVASPGRLKGEPPRLYIKIDRWNGHDWQLVDVYAWRSRANDPPVPRLRDFARLEPLGFQAEWLPADYREGLLP